MQKFISNLVKNAVAKQQKAYNNGHDNQGASIDVLAVAHHFAKFESANSKNRKADALAAHIDVWNTQNDNAITRGFNKDLDQEVVTYIAKEVLRFVSNSK